MAFINLQKFYKILLSFIIIIKAFTSAYTTCPKEIMFQVGTSSKCEAANGMTIPCDGSHILPVKKAYIDCNEGHFNGGQEALICNFDTGQWSTNPVRCFSHCDGDPDGIQLFDDKTKFKWYAEILKRPPINGEINVFPGVILASRLIMTLEKFFDPKIQWNFVNFVVRIYRPGSYQDYTIDRIEYKNDPVYSNDGTPKFDRMCMVVLSQENYIKIDEITRPTCLNYARDSIFNENRWFMEVMRAKPEYNIRPEYSTQCTVPHVDQNIDLSCYKDFKSDALRRCPKSTSILQTTCQIGYEKVNANGNDILSLCVGNRWMVDDHFDNGCKLICGEGGNNGEPEPLIYKGTPSDIKSAPWHVGIYSNNTKTSSSYELICSGSIIHRNIVISAAHCFYNKVLRRTDDPGQFLVGAGKRFYSYRKSEITEQFVRVKEIHPLRTYDTSLLRDDIAVLVVSPDFTFTSTVKPVCIDWTTYWDYDLDNGTVGYIFGWGANSQEDILTQELSTASLNALSSDDCKLLNNKAEVSAASFCGVNDKGATACKGDSGGGFVVRRKFGSQERYVLWGIVSSGVANDYCSDGGITIFTNIQYFQEAIKSIITKNKQTLNSNNFSKLFYHQIYAHILWTPLSWVEKDLQLNLKGSA